jgi:hypothetical protein
VVRESYLSQTADMRYERNLIQHHTLDPSVLAILWDVDVPQYQRLDSTLSIK